MSEMWLVVEEFGPVVLCKAVNKSQDWPWDSFLLALHLHSVHSQSKMAGHPGSVKHPPTEFMLMALCVVAAWFCGMENCYLISHKTFFSKIKVGFKM